MEASFEIVRTMSAEPGKGVRVFTVWHGISRNALIALLTMKTGGMKGEGKFDFSQWATVANRVEMHDGLPAWRLGRSQDETFAEELGAEILDHVRTYGHLLELLLPDILNEKSIEEN